MGLGRSGGCRHWVGASGGGGANLGHPGELLGTRWGLLIACSSLGEEEGCRLGLGPPGGGTNPRKPPCPDTLVPPPLETPACGFQQPPAPEPYTSPAHPKAQQVRVGPGQEAWGQGEEPGWLGLGSSLGG